MKSKARFQRYGKYQRKMYWMNLTLSLILMSILVTVIFGLIFQMTAKDYQLVMDESVEKTLGNISLKGEIIVEALQTIERSEHKKRLIRAEGKAEHHLASYLLKEELTKLSSRYLNADFVLSVALADKDSSVINPYGTMFKKDFSKEFFGEEEVLQQQMDALKAQGAGAAISFPKQENLHYMRYGSEEGRDYFLFLSLPLAELTEFPPNVNWCLADKKGIIAWHGDMSEKQFQGFTTLTGGEVIEQEDYRIFSYFVKEMNWRLVAAYEKRKPDIGILFFYLLLPFLGLSFVISTISYWITRNLYRPIKELVMETKNWLPEENEEDEFRVLKKGAAQAYQWSCDLQKTRSEKEKLLKNKENRDLLFGILPKETVATGDQMYTVTVFSLHHVVSEETRYRFKQFLQERLEQYDKAKYINTEDISCAMILEVDTADQTKSLVSELLEGSPADSVQMAVSDPVFGLESIKTAYLQCSLLLEYKYLYRQQRFLTADLVKVRANENYSYPLSAENNLIQMLLTGQPESLKIYDQIIGQNETIVRTAPQIRYRFVLMLLATIYRVLREFYMEIPLTYELNDLENHWQDDEIFAKLRQDLKDILNFVASKEQKEDDHLAKTMLEYIDKHYHEDIMLVDLAEEINASEKYCSTLFKQAVGENFKSYLNAFRIEKAKEILGRNPQAKIGEVAEQVGFNSANTFIRVFSKQMGLTPKAYAEAYYKAGTDDRRESDHQI